MDLIIANHQDASIILQSDPMDVIFISSPHDKYKIKGSEQIESLSKKCCVLLFNDVTIQKENMFPPKLEHIQEALEFAQGKENLLVCCQAGISRSSAIAYLIHVQQTDVKTAFQILNPSIHYPNKLIISYGSILLKESTMVELMNQWKKASQIMTFHQ